MRVGMIKKFLQDESGQTTTEYILILAVVVTIFMQFKGKLMKMVNGLFVKLNDATEGIDLNEGSD